ncbi:hypothetical protein [Cellulomonas sp. KRMCY2]|uniref:hypothetical protein n=1 Tax=Cellulomonas sp. KRMCY2 TaxID=1304865 RepID=UPI00045EC12C|nr:hypothetical protein [Cellulomonas sp. KRMCY2]
MDHSDVQSQRPTVDDAPTEIRRDSDGLRGPLDAIDAKGWDGPTATALLTYLRSRVVGPLVLDVGLRGAPGPYVKSVVTGVH